jgi:hypothetical protein
MPWTLPITDTMRIATYDMGYKIEVMKIRQPEGKPEYVDWETDGYFGKNLENALQGVFKRLLHGSEVEDIQMLLQAIETSCKRIECACASATKDIAKMAKLGEGAKRGKGEK